MKFSINKNTLQTTLQLLSGAVPTRSTLPIIGCALFTHKNNNLFIRTTDLEISITLGCNVENGEDGCVAIPLNKLLEITNAMPYNEIFFNISDIGKVNIECNSGTYTIMCQPHEEFPSEQQIENGQKLVFSGKELKNIIYMCNKKNSIDELKLILKKHSDFKIFLDLPIGRIKPPNNRYSIEDLIPIINSNKQIHYLAISNVESSSDLQKYFE